MNNSSIEPASQSVGATVLISAKLLGRERAPGDYIAPEEFAEVSDKVMGALFRQGVIAEGHVDQRPLTAAEQKLEKRLATARTMLATVEKQLADIREKHGVAVAARDKAKDQADRLAFKAAVGDPKAKGKHSELRARQREAEDAVEYLEAAKTGALAEISKVKAKSAKLMRERRVMDAQSVANDRILAVREIVQVVGKLAPLIKKYNDLGMQHSRLTETKSTQTLSPWRLTSFLNDRLGLDYVEPAMRVADFVALEKRVLDMATAQIPEEVE